MLSSIKYLSLYGLFFALVVLPLLSGLIYAFLLSVGLIDIYGSGITMIHWKRVVEDGDFVRSYLFSHWAASITLTVSTSCALLYSIFRQVNGTWKFRYYWFFFPLCLPPIVMAFLGIQFLSQSGLLSRLAYHINWIESLDEFPVIIQDYWGIGIIMAHITMATPFIILMFQQIIVKDRLEEYLMLARSLGADSKQLYHRIFIPILFRKAFPTLLLYYIFVLGSYEIPLLLGNQSHEMISVLIVRKLQKYNLQDIPQAYAMSIIYTVIVMLSLYFLLKAFSWRAGKY